MKIENNKMKLKQLILTILLRIIQSFALLTWGWFVFIWVVDVLNSNNVIGAVLFLIFKIVLSIGSLLVVVIYLEYWFSFLGLKISFEHPAPEFNRRLRVFLNKVENINN